jgi:hypothetical protein
MKDCPEGKIRNPATKRCVKKDGKMGKAVLARIPANSLPPDITNRIIDMAYQNGDRNMKAKARVLNKDAKEKTQYSESSKKEDQMMSLLKKEINALPEVVAASKHVSWGKLPKNNKPLEGDVPLFGDQYLGSRIELNFSYGGKRRSLCAYHKKTILDSNVSVQYTTYLGEHERVMAIYTWHDNKANFLVLKESKMDRNRKYFVNMIKENILELHVEVENLILMQMSVLLGHLTRKYNSIFEKKESKKIVNLNIKRIDDVINGVLPRGRAVNIHLFDNL